MKKTLFLVAPLALAACIACGKAEKTAPVAAVSSPLEGTVTFLTGNVTINGASAVPGMKIRTEDVIETGEKSAAIVQFAESSMLQIKSRTSMSIDRLDRTDRDVIALSQTKGECFNKIVKGKAEYSVRSKTCVAAVRGTAFLFCTTPEGDSDVSLLHGSVHISNQLKSSDVALLEENKRISLSGGKLSPQTKLTSAEISDLAALDSIGFLSVDELEKGPQSKVDDTRRETLTTDNDQRSIQYLRLKYGKLSVITTADGKTFIGQFRQTGKTIEITTAYGKESISSSKITKIAPYTK